MNRAIGITLIIITSNLVSVLGQSNSDRLTAAIESYDNQYDNIENHDSVLLEIIQTGENLPINDSVLISYYNQAIKSYYNYRIQGFEHRTKVFKWQQISTIIIFFVVIFLVLIGIYFSWLQFKRALDRNEFDNSELEISANKLKIKSSILGLLILFVSIAFLYLYLIHVYPIRQIF